MSDSVDRGGRGGRGGRGDDDVIVVHLGSAGRRTADGGGRGGGGGGLFCGWLRLRTFSRDVPSITAAVAFLAGRVQRPSVGSGTVPGDVAQLPTGVAFLRLGLTIASVVVRTAALVAGRRSGPSANEACAAVETVAGTRPHNGPDMPNGPNGPYRRDMSERSDGDNTANATRQGTTRTISRQVAGLATVIAGRA